MRYHVVAAAAALLVTTAARADILPIGGGIIDPTVLHITSTGATGSDPVLLNNSTSFIVTNVSGQTIPSPIDIFFAVPVPGGSPPSLGSPIATMTSGQDLYTQVGCTPCDNSLSFTNFVGALANDLTPPITGVTSFTIYEDVLNAGLAGGASITVNGNFAAGTFVAPLAENTTTGTVFDTSFTNTGLFNTPSNGPPVPEPASLAVFASAIAGLGLLRRRWRRT